MNESIERTRATQRQHLLDEIARCEATVDSDGSFDTTDLMVQMGRPLTSQELRARLAKLNSNLQFELSPGDKSKMGVYVIENRDGQTVKRFVCGMESGFSPEFSVRHFKVKRVPDPYQPNAWREVREFYRETRGWRTVLARLLRERLLTLPQIEVAFDTLGGRDSQNWQRLTN